MATAATLPAIAKAIDRTLVRLGGIEARFTNVEARLDSIEARQFEFGKTLGQFSKRLSKVEKSTSKLERQVTVLGKTIDRVIDYAADTKLQVEQAEQATVRLRERFEKTFGHFDVLVDISEKHASEIAALGTGLDRLDKKVAAFAR